MIAFLISLLVCILLGYLAASFFWPPGLSKATLWSLAWPTGAGLCSLIFFLFRRPMFTVEFTLLLVLAAVWYFRRPPGSSHSPSLTLPPVSLLAAGVIGFIIAGMLFIVHQDPHGDWDAFAIWNSHARYLYRDGAAWQTDIQNSFHPDYPLLVPSMNARGWRYAGEEIPETGGWLGVVYTLSTLAVLIATLVELRGLRLAIIIGSVLIGTPFFLEFGAMQSADVPLSLYFVSVIALLCLYSERGIGNSGLLVLAGFMSGCAGWTKNEGLVFIVAISVSMLVPMLGRRSIAFKRFGSFAVGLALPLAVILLFKSTTGLPRDYAGERQYQEIIGKLVSPDRYVTITANFAKNVWSFGDWAINPIIPLLLFVALCVFGGKAIRSFGWLTGASALVLLMVGYFAIYLMATYDLQYLLDASNPRLFLQVWPSFLLLAGALAVQYDHAS